MRTKTFILSALAITTCATALAQQAYPSRPVRVIIPYAPGGASDATGRVVAQKLSEALKQQFVIDNRPGASGSLGRELTARAAPDGHTLLIADAPHTINVHVLKHVPYDPIKDFTAITLLASAPQALVIHGNYLTEQHIAFLARHPQLTVVYCPRTHARFQHPTHPFRQMQQAGVRVVLGTDGRSTNPDLSVLRELQHILTMNPDLDISSVLHMATTSAATALGLPTLSLPIRLGQPLHCTRLQLPSAELSLTQALRHPDLQPIPVSDQH